MPGLCRSMQQPYLINIKLTRGWYRTNHIKLFKMKSMKISALITAIMFISATAFTQSEKPSNGMDSHEGHNHAAITGNTVNKEAKQMEQSKKDTGLSALLTHYYDIKNALVKTDGAAASVKAAEFVTAIKAIDMTAMSEAEHNAFMPLQQKLISDAEQVAATKNVERQRDRFNDFSNNMFALAKAINLLAPVYQQYCPMKKTYWLSSEAAIKNPYYGSAMLTCGEVVETINN